MKPKTLTSLLAACTAVGAMCARGETYTLVNTSGTSSDPAEFSDLNNWTVGGETATVLPGAGDTITWEGGDWIYPYIALDGDYSVGSLTKSFRRPHWVKSANAWQDVVTLTFVTKLGGGAYQNYFVHQGVKVVVAEGATLHGATSDATQSEATVQDGGEIDVLGAVNSRHIRWFVKNGGTLYFAPTSYTQTSHSDSINDRFTIDGATSSIVFPNGLIITGGNSSWANQFNHNDGTVTFGGPFTSNSPWTYTWSGGTINVTDDCTFSGTVVLTVPASKSVALDVAAGKTFAAPGLVADASATITKTGAGTFAFAPTTASIVLQEGAIGLASAATYDLSTVLLGSGATASIALIAMSARVDSLPSALSGATFTADLSSVAQGTVVFYSSDPSVLAKVQSDLASSVPQGFQLAVSGDALSLEAVSDYVFNTSGDLLSDLTSWSTGSLPPAGAEVAIDGANVVADFTGGTIPAWASIEVKNGATLKVSADADLPHIVLNKNATLEIASGKTYLTNGLFCTPAVVGENVSLPVLSVATNATLTISGGMKFKNVDFRLYGKLSKESVAAKGPVFGYAENGETSYIAFTSDGGVFDIHAETGSDSSLAQVNFLCPASGGTVKAVGTITLRNTGREVKGWNDMGDVKFGSDNPTTEPFDVLVDGTHLDISGEFYVAGAAHLSLVNGSYVRRAPSCLGHYFNQAIRGAATIAVGEGCFLDFTTGDGSFGIDNQSVVDSVIVRDGGAYTVSYNSSGWGKGVFVSDGGVLGVTKLYKPSSGDPRARTDLLRGFGSARLDGDLAIASVNMGTGNTDWDRHVKMANVPFAGTGDVTITNGVPEYPFTVTMVNGANTATGSIKVAKAEGDAETTLYFADGANWAGTVVAGNIALTNLTGGATAATATFGTLDLAADFPLRVWKTGGVLTTNDVLKVDSFAGTENIAIVEMDEELAPGDKFVIGKVKSTEALPKLGSRFAVKVGEPDADGYSDITAQYSQGFQVILR